MKSLQEYLREQAPSVREQESKREEARRDWIEAVDRLMARIKSWLAESDPDRILEVTSRSIEKAERSIGTYQIPSLEIRLGDREVTVELVAHDVLSPGGGPGRRRLRGRVDLVGPSGSCHLYLAGEGPTDEVWEIVDDRDFLVRPFAKDAFEAALVRLFE